MGRQMARARGGSLACGFRGGSKPSLTLLVERCVPGKEIVIRLQLRAAVNGSGVCSMFWKLLEHFHVVLHHLPVQVVQAPVVWGSKGKAGSERVGDESASLPGKPQHSSDSRRAASVPFLSRWKRGKILVTHLTPPGLPRETGHADK